MRDAEETISVAAQRNEQNELLYKDLFLQFGALGAEKLDRFKTLLVDRQSVPYDLIAVAIESGSSLNHDDMVSKIIEMQEAIEVEILTTLGSANYIKYRTAYDSAPQR